MKTKEMKTKTRSKLLSANLANLFKEINSTFGHAKELVLEAYNLALQEKFTPQEAKQLLVDNVTIFKKLKSMPVYLQNVKIQSSKEQVILVTKQK